MSLKSHLSPTYLSSHLFLRFPKNLKNLKFHLFRLHHLFHLNRLNLIHPTYLMNL
jgi:hypothetical protein